MLIMTAVFEAVRAYQNKYIKDSDTCSLSFHIGYTVPIQYEDGGPWSHQRG